ncbi:hypothetical protein T190820D02B_10299 [Tenacibaculum sp. 190524A05c]
MFPNKFSSNISKNVKTTQKIVKNWTQKSINKAFFANFFVKDFEVF